MYNLIRIGLITGLLGLLACSAPTAPLEERVADAPGSPAAKSPGAGLAQDTAKEPPGIGPLEEIPPGTFLLTELSPQFTVFSPFEATLPELGRNIGTSIQSMYQTTKKQGWKKEGPALVVVRGPLGGATVAAEVTFALGAVADGAEGFGLQTGTLPGGDAVVGVHKGSLHSLPQTNQELDAWIATNQKTARGDLRWFVFLNRPDQVNETELLTAVIQPVN
jgi:effector-binding domain-containing protein